MTPQSSLSADSGAYRFPNIPIGTYTVTFELAGFRLVVREGVVVQTGFNAEVNARLELSCVEESIVVRGESPIVDTRSTTLVTNYTKEMLDSIPSARDPWVILEQTPGMVMNEPAERRRQLVGPAVGRSRARQQLESAMEPRRRHRHRHGLLVVARVLRLRFIRGDSDSNGRQRRVAGRGRRGHQLHHEERGQRTQGIEPAVRDRQQLRVAQQHAPAPGAGRRRGQPDQEHQGVRRRDRRADQAQQGMVLGRGEPERHRGRDRELPQAGRDRSQRPRQSPDGPDDPAEPERQDPVPVGARS